MPELTHGIFTRLGGASAAPYGPLNLGGNAGDDPDAVEENYTRVYGVLDVNPDRACSVWQVHSADTVIVKNPIKGRRWVAKADGMVTDSPDTPLVMRFADCTPVLLHDPVQRVIGIAHAGWRGTVQGAGVSVLQTMVDAFGCDVRDVRAGIGPAIGPDCYQVGEEVVEAVEARFGTVDGLIQRHIGDGTAYLNLWEANARDLHRHGVQHIEIAGICTASNTHEFHSHRAEKGKTGRFAAVLSL
ncbi:MAG: peptidoglycan editing factor PgeF [Chloroflexota bacterium]